MYRLFILTLAFFILSLCETHSSWSKADFRPKILSRNELAQLHALTAGRQSGDRFNQTLNQILIPRVSGTANNFQVFNVLKNHFQDLGWHVEEDAFSDNTPLGTKAFRNLIATLNPQACKRLVFACHYDSKLFANAKFLGATDSAVPCAMMTTIASELDPMLKSQLIRDSSGTTLQFIFFDGEEAFVSWTATDSLYGSRHLAEKWNKTPAPSFCASGSGDTLSEIDRIELFVLLDLLGAKSPSFYSFFPETDEYYKSMMSIEQDLNNAGLMLRSGRGKAVNYFKNKRSFGFIEDDHVPFMRKGVRILHLIPSPFPSVWHTLSDNESALDHSTIQNLMAVFRSFIAGYLHLDLES